MLDKPSADQAGYEQSLRHHRTQKAAECILDLAFAAKQPRSVVDVGCGVGTWLSTARQKGAKEVLGLDSPDVPLSSLQISRDEFIACNLASPPNLKRRFDFAISLEVAEHLPPECGERFAAYLCDLAPTILFSAAIPHQTGNHHINLRSQSYWVEQFAKAGKTCLDIIRPRVWNCEYVPYWYAQNAFVFSDDAEVTAHFKDEAVTALTLLNVVHPELLDMYARQVARRSAKGLFSSLRRHATKHGGG